MRILGMGLMFLLPFCGKAAEAKQPESLGEVQLLMKEEIERDLSVDLRKRVQWVDESTGDAKITLQYASNSGELSVTQDMNVILIHDKSGSMDVNFGYHLAKVREGWGTLEKSIPYPILNQKKWSETILEEGSSSDLESEGAEKYLQRINCPNEYTKKLGAEIGYVQKENDTSFYRYEVTFNSPCQMDQHYYLLIQDDERSQIPAWRMVHGKNLYNIENTDLHHYIRIEASDMQTSRDKAVELIEQGFRVVRMTTDSGSYYSEKGETKITENLYFWDVSTLERYGGKWILNTCVQETCCNNDRLEKSQTFMSTLIGNILSLNPENKIAYIPFWGDVPENGAWKNYEGNSAGNGLVELRDYKSLLTFREGASRINFTSDPTVLHTQINHPFTYHGTNWSKAFQSAKEFLDARSEEDKKKETLILFLTDGMPQGTQGKESDFNNPEISGLLMDSSGTFIGGTLKQLKDVPGVTVWAVGIGVNELDSTGVKDRLEIVNDDGQPFYARYPADFEVLTRSVLNKIHSVYSEKFYAFDAFYQDSLSSSFALDMDKIDENWIILKEEESKIFVHGVPENVYELIAKQGTQKETCIYAEKTKTVYWYLGELTNGGLETNGHSLEIPLKFLKYSEATNGVEKFFAANNSQKITYHTTIDPEKVFTKSIETPKLVFYKTDSEVCVKKELAKKRQEPVQCRFAFSKEKYTDGIVKNVEEILTLEIPAGELQAVGRVYGLENGTYYVYEVDKNHRILNPKVQEVQVDDQPTIMTKEKSNLIPWSVTKSDQGSVSNFNNYLKMEFKDMVTFESGGDLTIVKEIDASENTLWWDHGNPTFMVRLQGIGTDGNRYSFYHMFEFTKEYVAEHRKNGKVSMSHTFYELPLSAEYIVEEVRVSRYGLNHISQWDKDGNPCGSIEEKIGEGTDGFYRLYAKVNLQKHPQGVTVLLYNEKINENWFNHVACVQNIIKSNK